MPCVRPLALMGDLDLTILLIRILLHTPTLSKTIYTVFYSTSASYFPLPLLCTTLSFPFCYGYVPTYPTLIIYPLSVLLLFVFLSCQYQCTLCNNLIFTFFHLHTPFFFSFYFLFTHFSIPHFFLLPPLPRLLLQVSYSSFRSFLRPFTYTPLPIVFLSYSPQLPYSHVFLLCSFTCSLMLADVSFLFHSVSPSHFIACPLPYCPIIFSVFLPLRFIICLCSYPDPCDRPESLLITHPHFPISLPYLIS